jgi:hypothetical protein
MLHVASFAHPLSGSLIGLLVFLERSLCVHQLNGIGAVVDVVHGRFVKDRKTLSSLFASAWLRGCMICAVASMLLRDEISKNIQIGGLVFDDRSASDGAAGPTAGQPRCGSRCEV